MYVDAHLHLFDTAKMQEVKTAHAQTEQLKTLPVKRWCASAKNRQEFAWHEALQECGVVCSFGVHPQNPTTAEIAVLESLAAEKRIAAVGEVGFDLFNREFRTHYQEQKYVWEAQLEIARRYDLPIIIHCRKALHEFFSYTAALKKLPAVVFHGWGGSLTEANSFLKKGVSALFSVGKDILRGKKTSTETAAGIDVRFLLTETDAPYMRLKTQVYTQPADITAVAAQCAALRNVQTKDSEAELLRQIEKNFTRTFCN